MTDSSEYLAHMAVAVTTYIERCGNLNGQTTLLGSSIAGLVYTVIVPRLHQVHPRWRSDVLQSGSSVESQSNEDFDYMICVRSLRLSPFGTWYRHLESPHPTTKGFVCYHLDQKHDAELISLWSDCCVEYNGELYLSSQKVKRKLLEELQKMAEVLQTVGDLQEIEDNGAAITLYFSTLLGGDPADESNAFTIDLVLAVPANGWPLDIVIGRDLASLNPKHNPFHEKLYKLYRQDATQGNCFHLIAKCSDPESEEIVSSELEWRLSFSRAECKIQHIQDEHYYTCLGMHPPDRILFMSNDTASVLLKRLAKAFLFPPKIFTSYHVKTILFHTNESLDPAFWIDPVLCFGLPAKPTGYLKAMEFLNILLKNTVQCLREKKVEHFFIPDLNLLQNVSPDNLQLILNTMTEIATDPLHYLSQLEEVAPKPSSKGPGFNYVEVRMATDYAIPCVNGQRQKSVFLPSENGLKISFEPASRNKNSEKREDISDEDELSFDVLVLGNLGK